MQTFFWLAFSYLVPTGAALTVYWRTYSMLKTLGVWVLAVFVVVACAMRWA